MVCDRKTVALCTSRIHDPQMYDFIVKFNDMLRSNNISLFIYTINSDLYWNEDVFAPETYVFDLIPYERIDCLVLMDEKIKSKKLGRKLCERAAGADCPVLVVDGAYEGFASLQFDYEYGFEQIVRHMIEHHGIRRPHFMAGIKDNPFSDARIEIFKKVIAENGIPYDEERMLSYGAFWALPARKAIQAVIDSGDLPEAVICANDIMAINVAEVLKTNGIAVPDQVMVSGFDGYEEVRHTEPRISTMNCRYDLLAQTAAELILDGRLAQNTGETFYVKPMEQFAESCGCTYSEEGNGFLINNFNDKFYRYQDDVSVFHNISIQMLNSNSKEKVMSHFDTTLMHDMCCVIDSDCFCHSKNYFGDDNNDLLSKELCVVYDSYAPDREITPMAAEDIVPSLEQRLQNGYPLIFDSIPFMDKPLGYICFSFPDYNITDYAKTTSIVNSVSMGFGGYINMRYQKYLYNKVEEMYRNDNLTGLYNRTAFNASFAEIQKDPDNIGKEIHVIMADLDGLKCINDTYGHDAGDVAISTSAAALRNACPPGSLLLRFGGDEMIAVIFGECVEQDILNRLEDYLKNFNAHSGLPYTVAASCGYYCTHLTEDFEFESAVKLADQEMYQNKKMRKLASA